jgi:YgiT-type zinc finger domain-containing protein
MELKRIYRFPEGWKADRNTRDPERATKRNPFGLKDPARREGDVLNPPPVDHFQIKHTGVKPEQNFSQKMIEAGQVAGFLTISKGELILHAKPEDLHYTIVRGPGYYCCHCGEQIVDANQFVKDEEGEPTEQTIGMLHVEEAHDGKESPDPNNPSGYRRVHGYETVLEEKQHKKFNLQEFQRKRLEGGKRSKKSAQRSQDNG